MEDRWLGWPTDAEPFELLDVYLDIPLGDLVDLVLGGHNDFSCKSIEAFGSFDATLSCWADSPREAEEAEAAGPEAHEPHEGSCRVLRASGVSMGSRYSTNESTRVTRFEADARVVAETCVHAAVTYGDSFRPIVHIELSAWAGGHSRYRCEGAVRFIKPVNRLVRGLIVRGARDGMVKGYAKVRDEVLPQFGSVSKEPPPEVTAEVEEPEAEAARAVAAAAAAAATAAAVAAADAAAQAARAPPAALGRLLGDRLASLAWAFSAPLGAPSPPAGVGGAEAVPPPPPLSRVGTAAALGVAALLLALEAAARAAAASAARGPAPLAALVAASDVPTTARGLVASVAVALLARWAVGVAIGCAASAAGALRGVRGGTVAVVRRPVSAARAALGGLIGGSLAPGRRGGRGADPDADVPLPPPTASTLTSTNAHMDPTIHDEDEAESPHKLGGFEEAVLRMDTEVAQETAVEPDLTARAMDAVTNVFTGNWAAFWSGGDIQPMPAAGRAEAPAAAAAASPSTKGRREGPSTAAAGGDAPVSVADAAADATAAQGGSPSSASESSSGAFDLFGWIPGLGGGAPSDKEKKKSRGGAGSAGGEGEGEGGRARAGGKAESAPRPPPPGGPADGPGEAPAAPSAPRPKPRRVVGAAVTLEEALMSPSRSARSLSQGANLARREASMAIMEEVFENERLQPFRGWGHTWPGHFLPTDRAARWTSRDCDAPAPAAQTGDGRGAKEVAVGAGGALSPVTAVSPVASPTGASSGAVTVASVAAAAAAAAVARAVAEEAAATAGAAARGEAAHGEGGGGGPASKDAEQGPHGIAAAALVVAVPPADPSLAAVSLAASAPAAPALATRRSRSSQVFLDVAPRLPPGWRWVEDTWHLDLGGMMVDAVDAEGWSYGLNFSSIVFPFRSGGGKKRISDFTRRRRWIRTRVPIVLADQAATVAVAVDAASVPIATVAVDAASAPIAAVAVDSASAPIAAVAVDAASAPIAAVAVDAASAPAVDRRSPVPGTPHNIVGETAPDSAAGAGGTTGQAGVATWREGETEGATSILDGAEGIGAETAAPGGEGAGQAAAGVGEAERVIPSAAEPERAASLADEPEGATPSATAPGAGAAGIEEAATPAPSPRPLASSPVDVPALRPILATRSAASSLAGSSPSGSPRLAGRHSPVDTPALPALEDVPAPPRSCVGSPPPLPPIFEGLEAEPAHEASDLSFEAGSVPVIWDRSLEAGAGTHPPAPAAGDEEPAAIAPARADLPDAGEETGAGSAVVAASAAGAAPRAAPEFARPAEHVTPEPAGGRPSAPAATGPAGEPAGEPLAAVVVSLASTRAPMPLAVSPATSIRSSTSALDPSGGSGDLGHLHLGGGKAAERGRPAPPSGGSPTSSSRAGSPARPVSIPGRHASPGSASSPLSALPLVGGGGWLPWLSSGGGGSAPTSTGSLADSSSEPARGAESAAAPPLAARRVARTTSAVAALEAGGSSLSQEERQALLLQAALELSLGEGDEGGRRTASQREATPAGPAPLGGAVRPAALAGSQRSALGEAPLPSDEAAADLDPPSLYSSAEGGGSDR